MHLLFKDSDAVFQLCLQFLLCIVDIVHVINFYFQLIDALFGDFRAIFLIVKLDLLLRQLTFEFADYSLLFFHVSFVARYFVLQLTLTAD